MKKISAVILVFASINAMAKMDPTDARKRLDRLHTEASRNVTKNKNEIIGLHTKLSSSILAFNDIPTNNDKLKKILKVCSINSQKKLEEIKAADWDLAISGQLDSLEKSYKRGTEAIQSYIEASSCESCDTASREEAMERAQRKFSQATYDFMTLADHQSYADSYIDHYSKFILGCDFSELFKIRESLSFKLQDFYSDHFAPVLSIGELQSNEYLQALEFAAQNSPVRVNLDAKRIFRMTTFTSGKKATSKYSREKNAVTIMNTYWDMSIGQGIYRLQNPEIKNPIKVIHQSM